ncbi:MAG: MBL fold metallo-hydrolase [Nannocystaceae bacterium]|nr:MBL fold metallo-hydrolase [Nannocystaceae bacterium]
MRAIERAYLRVLLDPSYAERLDPVQHQLSSDEVELLRGLDPGGLEVERRGRRRHLWLRASAELPRTLRRAETRLPAPMLQSLRNRLYSEHIWHPERTMDLPVVGRGYEQATHIRDALEVLIGQHPSDELELLAALARLERSRLGANLTGADSRTNEGPVSCLFDLTRAAAEPGTPASALRLCTAHAWSVDRSGGIKMCLPGEETSHSLVVSSGVQIALESYRVNNHISASLHYLGLGRVAHDIGDIYAKMSRDSRAGGSDWFETSKAARFFRRERHELFLKDEFYFEHAPSLYDDDLAVGFHDRRSPRSLRVPVDEDLLDIFGELLPRLRRSLPEPQLRALCDDEQWGFLEELLEAGFLERAPTRPTRPREEHRLRFIGHATLEFATPSTRVLFDPLLVVRTRPEVDVLHELDDPIDAIAISHPHWDHFNLDTLLQVPRDTLMLVPRLIHPASLENVDMGALLTQLGFSRVHAIGPWESIDVGDIRITATPFHGEQSGPEVPQDWMTFHASAGGHSFFAAVDSCHNSHHSMDEVMREVRQRLGPVDVLFAPYSDFHYPIAMFTRRPFYMGPGMEQYSGGPDDAVRWCSILGAQALVPYAGFVWQPQDFLRSEDQTHRGSLARLRSLVKSHPRGPLLVLDPGGDGLRWSADSAEMRIPPSLLSLIHI